MTRDLVDALSALPATPEVAALRSRHCEYYRSLCHTALADASVGDDEAGTWVDVLERDVDNLRLALAWSIQQGDADAAIELASGSTGVWYQGRRTEGAEWLTRALAVPGDRNAIRVMGLIRAAAMLQSKTGQTTAAVTEPGRLIEEALIGARALGDGRLLSIALRTRAVQLVVQHGDDMESNFRAALELQDEAIGCARELGDEGRLVVSLAEARGFAMWLARLAGAEAEGRERAEAYGREAMAVAQASADEALQINELHRRAIYETFQRDLVAAERSWAELLAMARRMGRRDEQIMAVTSLAFVSQMLGRTDETVRWLLEGEQLGRGKCILLYEELPTHVLGSIALRRGEYDEAEAWVGQALAEYETMSDPGDRMLHGWQRTMGTMAHVAEAKGDLAAAREWMERRRRLEAAFTGAMAHRAGFMERRGDVFTAGRLFREASDGLRGNSPIVQNLRLGLDVSAAFVTGEIERLDDLLDRVRAAPRESISAIAKAQSFGRLGLLALSVADLDRARAIVDEGIEFAEADYPRWGLPELYLTRARVESTAGNHDLARGALGTVLANLDLLWEPLHLVDLAEMLGVSAADPSRSTELLGLAAAQRERYEYPLAPWQAPLVEEATRAAHAALGDGATAQERLGRGLELWPTMRRERDAAAA